MPAAAFAADVGQPNVRLQYDASHMQRTEEDLTATIDAYWPLISHIQIAGWLTEYRRRSP